MRGKIASENHYLRGWGVVVYRAINQGFTPLNNYVIHIT